MWLQSSLWSCCDRAVACCSCLVSTACSRVATCSLSVCLLFVRRSGGRKSARRYAVLMESTSSIKAWRRMSYWLIETPKVVASIKASSPSVAPTEELTGASFSKSGCFLLLLPTWYPDSRARALTASVRRKTCQRDSWERERDRGCPQSFATWGEVPEVNSSYLGSLLF